MRLGSWLRILVVMIVAMGMVLSARAQIGPYAMFSLGHYSGAGCGRWDQRNAERWDDGLRWDVRRL